MIVPFGSQKQDPALSSLKKNSSCWRPGEGRGIVKGRGNRGERRRETELVGETGITKRGKISREVYKGGVKMRFF